MGSTYELRDAGKWVDSLSPKMIAAAERGLVSAAARGVQEIVAKIIPSRTPQPVDRGVYRAGWKSEPVEGGADVYNDEPHAVMIEEGVRAENVKVGAAMIRALAEWAERKGLARKGGGASVAWAIATNLKKRGIFNRGGRGLGILKELVEERLPDIVEEEVARELDRADY